MRPLEPRISKTPVPGGWEEAGGGRDALDAWCVPFITPEGSDAWDAGRDSPPPPETLSANSAARRA